MWKLHSLQFTVLVVIVAFENKTFQSINVGSRINLSVISFWGNTSFEIEDGMMFICVIEETVKLMIY